MKIYGIPKTAMKSYRYMVAYGMHHDVAMAKLRDLYSMNLAESVKLSPALIGSILRRLP